MGFWEKAQAANDTSFLPARHRTLPILATVTPIATTSAAPNASIMPKNGVFAGNTAAAAKPEAWSRQA